MGNRRFAIVMVMKTKVQQTKTLQWWFVLGLVGTLLAAPNATAVRYGIEHTDPFLFNTLRFSLIGAITLPLLLIKIGKISKRSYRPALAAGFWMAVAVVAYVLAIKYSQASYVATITLLTPIVFILYSARMNKESITNRAVAGITLAAVGAMIIVALPLAIHQQGEFIFYPVATGWALLNCLSFPLALIYMRRANEAGMSMVPMMCISSWVVVAVNALCFMAIGTGTIATISNQALLGILYSGIVVALVARIISVVTYEHIGSVVTSALAYLETFLAILIPVLVLNEQLSIEMVIGGILILCGVYVVEHHKSKLHKHYHIFRLH
ncbi:DMT family transporter [soil metagenome]